MGPFGAFAPGCSPAGVAKLHCGARWLIKIDVQQFFESISERQVYRVFRQFGYEPLISFEMARLCTRTYASDNRRYRLSRWRDHRIRSIEVYRAADQRVGHLPQGAPTSPMLSNWAMAGFDAHMRQSAVRWGMAYSRYADDIALSTSDPRFDRDAALQVLGHTNRSLLKAGCRPRTDKVVIAPPGSRKVVLGLLVDGTQPRLTRHFRRSLEADIYGIETYGVIAHAGSRGWSSASALRDHIAGKLAFADTVDVALTTRLRARLDTALLAQR